MIGGIVGILLGALSAAMLVIVGYGVLLVATDPDVKLPQLPRRRRPHPHIAPPPPRPAARMVIEELSEAEKHLLWLFRNVSLELERVHADYAAGAIDQAEMEKRVEVCLLREELGQPTTVNPFDSESDVEPFIQYEAPRPYGRNVPSLSRRGVDWNRRFD